MEEGSVRKLILMHSIVAEIEGMKVENKQRESQNESWAYLAQDFFHLADELNHIAYLNDWQILEYTRSRE